MTAMKTAGRASTFPAQADIVESVDHYLVELDVSDFALAELRVQLDADRVTVIGDQVLGSDEIKPAFRLRERLEETFRLPEDSELDGVTALFEHGTLELCIPKRQQVRSEQRIIPIRKRQHGVIDPDVTPG